MITPQEIAKLLGYDISKIVIYCADMLIAANAKAEAELLMDTLNVFAKLPKFYTNETIEDPICTMRLYREIEGGIWEWFPLEYSKEEGSLFGLVKGFEAELGYFPITDVDDAIIDGSWTPKPLSQVKNG